MMDTFVTIYAVGPKRLTSRAIDLALDRMQEIDTKFNSYNPKSPVYQFNYKGVQLTDPEILDVVELALRIARDSNGAFDITVAPLIELWGFSGETPRLPGKEEVKDCLSRIGYRYLVLEDSKLEKIKESVRIELGGIAKGYAVSQAASVLRTEGVTSALIDAGGDVYALGRRGNDLWKVGIRNPRGDKPMSDNAILAALRRMGIDKDEMSGHGFRAMARTILDEVLGVRIDYIEHQLAHAVRDPNGRAYNRTAHLPERKKMMQNWADYLDKLKAGAEIISINQRV